MAKHPWDPTQPFLPREHPAARELNRDICVSAGAGCGKTSILVARFINLVLAGVGVEEILAITFTDKAAMEMRARIAEEFACLGKETERRQVESAYISTIHSFCARLLREYPFAAGVDPRFSVLDEQQSGMLFRRSLDEAILQAFTQEPAACARLVAALQKEKRLRECLELCYARMRTRGLRATDLRPMEDASLPSPREAREGLEQALSKFLEARELAAGRSYATAAAEAAQTLQRQLRRLRLCGWEDRTSDDEFWEYLEALDSCKVGSRLGPLQELGNDLQAAMDVAFQAAAHGLHAQLTRDFCSVVERLDSEYTARKREVAGLDFSDLELLARDLLTNPAVRAEVAGRFRHILVDEYQDVNPLQDEIIGQLRGERNLFVVGDVKQSIYRFRHADVGRFQDRMQAATTGDQEQVWLIPLQRNFRSSAKILAWVNAFFQDLWVEKRAPEYEPLYLGAKVDEGPRSGVRILRPGGEEAEDENVPATAEERRVREARAIARYVLDLVESEQAQVLEAGEPRPLRYGDILILFRASPDMVIYEHALADAGVPYYSISDRGFYARREVRDALNFLRTVDDPTRDVPLAATLRSPFVRSDDPSLAALVAKTKGPPGQMDTERPLWRALQGEGSRGEALGDLFASVAPFAEELQRLRKERSRARLSRLLSRALDVSEYRASLLAQPGGHRAFANLEKLGRVLDSVDEAGGTLGDAVRAIEEMEIAEVREGESQLAGAESDAVTMMTWHKAKGLEAEVVILADLSRGLRADRPNVSLKDTGEAGLQYRLPLNPKRAICPDSVDQYEAEETKKDEYERERLLYVAMTRAKQILVLSGLERKERECYANWILDFADKSGQPLLQEMVADLGQQPPALGRSRQPLKQRFAQRIKSTTPLPADDSEAQARVARALEVVRWQPAPARQDFSASATDLLDCYVCPYRYRLRVVDGIGERPVAGMGQRVGTVGPAERGSIAHQALRTMDFLRLPDLPTHVRQSAASLGLSALAQDEVDQVADWLERFLAGPLREAFQSATWREHEMPFCAAVGPARLRGRMDCVLKGPEGAMLIDFKTHRVDAAGVVALAAEHAFQLQVYSAALVPFLRDGGLSAGLWYLQPAIHQPVPLKPLAAVAEEVQGIVAGICSQEFGKRGALDQHCFTCGYYPWYCPGGGT